MNKIIIPITLMLLPVLSFANGVHFGRVVDVKGSAFISFLGKTHEIKKGEVLYTDSEIVVEHSGQVTFTDNADHRFHLSNSSSAVIFSKKVELRSGDLWVQSINKMDDYELTTANAKINYQGGEAILSYDSFKGKSQLMVISGLMKLSNLRAPELNLTVAEGNFSFVDMAFEEGMPRDPTPVGQKTYSSLVSLFPGVSPMDKVSGEIFKDQSKHKKIGNHQGRTIASANQPDFELEKQYKEKILQMTKKENKKARSEDKSKKLVVKIYGQKDSDKSVTTAIYDLPAKKETSHRAPASAGDLIVDEPVPTPENSESNKLIEQLNKL